MKPQPYKIKSIKIIICLNQLYIAYQTFLRLQNK